MASSKVMASSTSTNPDLARQTSTYSLSIGGDLPATGDPPKFGSMSMDELMRNLYGNTNPNSTNPTDNNIIVATATGTELDPQPQPQPQQQPPTCLSRQGSLEIGTKTAEEVWKEISGNNNSDQKMVNEMTLEEFLTKAGAVREEDMKIPQMVGPVHGFVVDPAIDSRFTQQQQQQGEGGGGSGSILWLGNGGDRAGGGRGKRRAVVEPVDKVAQQRQKRMIKNRESAARSRERKQAYTVELESLVTQLEEENARLQREKVERNRERYKQLMEHLVPIDEKRRPQGRPVLRRSNSAHW